MTAVPDGGSSEDGGADSELVSAPLLFKISSPEHQSIESEKKARELKVKPGRIRLGFYDASLETDLTSGTRSAIREQSIQLVRVKNLEERLSVVESPKAEVEFHPFGLINQYETAENLYQPGHIY